MQAKATHHVIRTASNEIWLDEEGILHVRTTDVTEIDLDEVKACFEVYEQLGLAQKKVLQLMDTRNSVTVTREARDYAEAHGHRYLLASAVVGNSLAVRLVVNFFGVYYRQKVPFKMFGSEKEALQWLRRFKK